MEVRVWNDNVYPYKEVFQDERIEIPPGKFIMMDEKKAIMFKGSFAPMKLNAQKQPMPESFKMIRIESKSVPLKEEMPKFICQQDGKEFTSQAELDKWIDENHLDKLTDAKVADERRKNKK